MQINKSKKPSSRQSPNNLFDNDFASGFEDSKFDKFKPVIKALIVVFLLVGAVWGALSYYGATDEGNDANKNYTSNTSQPKEDMDAKLSQCLSDANAANPTPDTSDNGFWPKIIAGYDAQLGCYDQYPDAIGAVSRSSTEYARENAIDSSGSYKDTYLSTNSYEYKPSTSSGSSQYTSPSTSGGSTGTPSNDSPSSTQPAVDTQWCSAKKAEVDSLYASNQEARTNYQNARGKVDAIDAQLRNVSTARPPGGHSLNQHQIDLWRDSERRRLTTERATLVTQMDYANTAYNSASYQYTNAHREYVSKSCS